jgi:hypothetical protein
MAEKTAARDAKTDVRNRRAEALRANLRRRKEQARARAEGQTRPSDSDGKA